MKNAILIIAMFFFTSQIFAQLSADKLTGEWTYAVSTDEGDVTGKIKFTNTDNKLAGTVIADDGTRMTVNKLEIKDGNKIYFEVTPEYDVFKVTLKVDGKKLNGYGGPTGQDFSITGVKKE
jgi:hypothetical protein